MNTRKRATWLAAGLLAMTVAAAQAEEAGANPPRPRPPGLRPVSADTGNAAANPPRPPPAATPPISYNERLAQRTEAQRLAKEEADRKQLELLAGLAKAAAGEAIRKKQMEDQEAAEGITEEAEGQAEAAPQAFTGKALYLAVDLSGGPDAESYPVRYSAAPPDLSDDTCRTTEMWFRLIQPGTFMMGSPDTELGHHDNEDLHRVTLTKPFYMGVFQVTQKQFGLVTGRDQSGIKGDTRPVEQILHNSGESGHMEGAIWFNDMADATSFIEQLRAKTSLAANLPTEAQWEYACRAGTTTALNSGKDLTTITECPNVAEVARYRYNQDDGKGGYSEHAKVGMYLPNAWGLYDMHGNVHEWCLDNYENHLGTADATDPQGPAASGKGRVIRGGDYAQGRAQGCRSASRGMCPNVGASNLGFRACILPGSVPDGGAEQQIAKPGTPRTAVDAATYCVVDLSGGPDATKYPVRYSATPPDLDGDTCRTTEMWFRLIPPGTFMMGSPETELGRRDNEDLHRVTLTKPFYMGVFQVTQKQFELVMGDGYETAYKGDARPMEKIVFSELRGKANGAKWPKNDQVEATSFFGRLQAKASLAADLPTEAQWEYACRAGTSTMLNSGKDLTAKTICPNVAELCRYAHNTRDGKGDGSYSKHTKVGMYLPNAWGLYDMHGNVLELCLDWYVKNLGAADATDPKGPASSDEGRVIRGGEYGFADAKDCRSASRGKGPNVGLGNIGFRACIQPDPELTAAEKAQADLHLMKDEQHALVRYLREARKNTDGRLVLKHVRYLVEQGAGVNAKDEADDTPPSEKGQTPLHRAARLREGADAVLFLVSKGADIHARSAAGYTPLHLAARWNEDPETVQFLAAQGADVGAETQSGLTALHLAAAGKNLGAAAFLVTRGADVNAKDKDGRTPLFFAVWGEKKAEAVALLAASGADVNARDRRGVTPLHHAALNNANTEIIRTLISKGADVSAKDSDGDTPLDWAKDRGNTAVADYLYFSGLK